jgi:hypothetical protein
MDTVVSGLISAGLFYAFVPGVLLTLPKGGSKTTVLITHAVLFAVTVSVVMMAYWGMKERMTNYGPVCPNGYVESTNQGGKKDCVPLGQSTYPVNTGYSSNIPIPGK